MNSWMRVTHEIHEQCSSTNNDDSAIPVCCVTEAHRFRIHMIDTQVLFCFRGTWEEIGRVYCEITCLNPSDPVRGKNRAD